MKLKLWLPLAKKSEKSGKNKSQRRPNEHGSKYAIMLFIFSYKSAKQGKETNKNPLSYHGNERGKCKKNPKTSFPALHKRHEQLQC